MGFDKVKNKAAMTMENIRHCRLWEEFIGQLTFL